MTSPFTLPLSVQLTMIALLLAMVFSGIRIIRGPTAADRAVALDMLGLLGTAAAAMATLLSGSDAFIDIAMATALLGFLSAIAFAGFIERGSIREENSA